MLGQQLAGVGDGLAIRVQVALCRAQRSVPRDQPQVMNRHAGVRHPGQARVPEVVPPQVLRTRACPRPHPISSRLEEPPC